jgi:hypothetical protein
MHHISKIYFVTKFYMFRPSSVPIIRSYKLYTWQLVCFTQVMWPLPRRVRLELQPDSPRQGPHNLRETYQLPRVQLITPDDGHRRWPKHVEFRDKIKFGYLMHLVGYLYEAYHDARSLEYQGDRARRHSFSSMVYDHQVVFKRRGLGLKYRLQCKQQQ